MKSSDKLLNRYRINMKQLYIICILLLVLSPIKSTFVDLTHISDKDTIRYPFYKALNMTIEHRGIYTVSDGTETWLEYNTLYFSEHYGTHMDAPAHFADGPGYWRIHEIPVDHLIGDAVVIDISYKAHVKDNPDATLDVADLERWEDKHGRIKDGSIVFCYSGWDKYFYDWQRYMGSKDQDTSGFHFPGFGLDAATWLAENRNIVGIGSDTMSVDIGKDTNFPVHIKLLSRNIYALENVNNLGKIPSAGARVYLFPMNFRDASGTPTRVITEFNSKYIVGQQEPMPPMWGSASFISGSLSMYLVIAFFQYMF